ncbi:uncharacterized protein BO88DRAFT_452825 [Aspergillus vadensis CBS 113365]|uniref:Uncharacterized protein n=1 Tax=Aspergillus vadensis (strain CBS 113365 / IMI 142717 / IBT 24658) TaxID=1448311 RepID=A0A319BVE3_ASPVC|nr:hypothetical protein BO88DRAFT_452825 [Aspergillus vadensis CBS 113365]PYH69813.1 hypothetical protein BO88DRAFT_452825 [Aspergillus vadensis CBS 113365]
MDLTGIPLSNMLYKPLSPSPNVYKYYQSSLRQEHLHTLPFELPRQALFKMPQSSSTTPQERAQPWKAMQEIQSLSKPEVSAAAETADTAEEEEPLKLNLLRAQFNSTRSNIANMEEKH